MYPVDENASAAGSGGGVPPAQNSLVDQRYANCKGSRMFWCWFWCPLVLWDPISRKISGPPPGQVSAPGWRWGGMHQQAGYLCRWRQPWRSPSLDHGSALTTCSRPGVSLWQPGPTPPARRHQSWWYLSNTQCCIPTCCVNTPGG